MKTARVTNISGRPVVTFGYKGDNPFAHLPTLVMGLAENIPNGFYYLKNAVNVDGVVAWRPKGSQFEIKNGRVLFAIKD